MIAGAISRARRLHVLVKSIAARWSGRSTADGAELEVLYGRDFRLMLCVAAVLSVLELLVGTVFIPWWWLELLLVISGALGLVWVYGFVCAVKVRPHTVEGETLILRFAHSHEIRLPLGHVERVSTRARADYKKTLQIEDDVVALSCLGATSVVLHLSPGSTVSVDQLRRTDPEILPVREVCFAADDPRRAARDLSELVARCQASDRRVG